MNKLTLENIINTLKKDGINSKRIVVDALENATYEDLLELKWSITEKINLMKCNAKNIEKVEIKNGC